MTKKEMLKAIYLKFKNTQGEQKAKWVYNQLRNDLKKKVQRTCS